MPSKFSAPASRLWRVLRSQGLGLWCSQAVVWLLAVGSVVLAATREGASQHVGGDDLRAFFEPVRGVHAWFYALLAVMALYVVNTLLCTWQSVVGKLRARAASVTTWAAPLLHVGFVVAALAHLVGGFGGRELGVFQLDGRWQPLGDSEARVVSLEVEPQADGREKSARAVVELKHSGGAIETATLGWNEPLSSGWGTTLALLQQHGSVPLGARLRRGEARCELWADESCALASTVVRLSSVMPGFARVEVTDPEEAPRTLWLRRGVPQQGLTLEEVRESPAVLVRLRASPGNPWALAAALLTLVGLTLMGRRWKGSPPPDAVFGRRP